MNCEAVKTDFDCSEGFPKPSPKKSLWGGGAKSLFSCIYTIKLSREIGEKWNTYKFPDTGRPLTVRVCPLSTP